MKSDDNLTKRFSYPFVAILFTFFAVLSFLIVPTNTISGLAFAVSVGLGIFFSYKSIQYKKFSDRFIGVICFLITGFLAIITILSHFFNWDI